MQVIDCDCGVTLQAANKEDLVKRAREHLEADHSDTEMSDDEIAAMVDEKSYFATDS